MDEALVVKLPAGQVEFFPYNEVVLRRRDGESTSIVVPSAFAYAFFHGWALEVAEAVTSTREDKNDG